MFVVEDADVSLINELKDVASFDIFKNGAPTHIEKGEEKFASILDKLGGVFADGHLSPAFGVSLHADTLRAMKSGEWLKMNFAHTQTKNDLPFNALLIRLEDGCYGFNLIREHGGRMDGRCLYFDLNQLTDLTQLIK